MAGLQACAQPYPQLSSIFQTYSRENMIKITIVSVKADSSFVGEYAGFVEGDTAYYVMRESGKRISVYYDTELDALEDAWKKVKHYGFTLVEPW